MFMLRRPDNFTGGVSKRLIVAKFFGIFTKRLICLSKHFGTGMTFYTNFALSFNRRKFF